MRSKPTQPRMSDVAKAAGVSTMTVSRAFKQDASVNEKRRSEILRIADEMGYIFDKSASELRTKRTGFVAVTVPSINNSNFADTVRGLTDSLAESGLEALLGYTNYHIDQEEQIIKQLLRRKPEAMVVTGSTHTDKTRSRLKRSGIPVVECWDEPHNPVGYSVGYSGAAAGSMVADHLVERGYKRIGFIGGHTQTDTRGTDRQRGFTERLREHGLPHDRIISVGPPPVGMAQGARGAQLLLERFPDTDAIMCVADSAAFGAMTEFQRSGMRIPDDIAVAGFGAFDVGAFSLPDITTIDPKGYAIGEGAGRLIAALLAGTAGSGSGSHVSIEPSLVVRHST
ncbi:LacI family DNA-binding transcriptional regulator [Hoeflea prorocentri]|uniref:LacI family DNA-binding transcriptional regulator n=1 Tax=Hoeflea prorocentri TaxID=1922333 RepID=A0A9X3UIA7_9HYPH|nr:LacI family DNA-binding transcriptional regulator [Hoeflea prorocentri]MCY6379714.1 LacI family DNA-binding transcriptional regulator [Hoeflea prorocentri]MDA5397514.1 LacI family DNA-binding transcriptional regulator [Hoeflea prorocentri]